LVDSAANSPALSAAEYACDSLEKSQINVTVTTKSLTRIEFLRLGEKCPKF
jgi:hypothetical protein